MSNRKLDALFHDKVLRKNAEYGLVPPYTASLDAAWKGVISQTKSSLFSFRAGLEYDGRYKAVLSFPRDCLSYHGESDHHAEAIVLACLRAAGVSEERITAATAKPEK